MSDGVPAEFQNAPPWLVWEEASVILPLTKGRCTLIDSADWALAQTAPYLGVWRCTRKHHTPLYYVAWGRKGCGERTYLHRKIMNAPKGMVVDHINGDPLDNRRANLRVCTIRDNVRYRKANAGNTSGYKGVYARTGKPRPWYSRIECAGVQHYLGSFLTAEDAALAYNEAALKHFGEFAYLNVVPDVPG